VTDATRYIAGILILSIVTIEVGGWFMTRIARGGVPMTEFQKSFARAGHGHAGMLVTVSLVGLLFADAAGAHGLVGWLARLGVPAAAVLMPAGFFAAASGRGEAAGPNRLMWIVWAGAASLAIGAVSLGVAVLTA
jgi:hypothetical protein